MEVRPWLQAVIDEWQGQRPAARLHTVFPDQHGAGTIVAERTLNQALVNILNNAADVSPDSVALHADWDDRQLHLQIYDRGPGLGADIHHRLGKQPVSTKQEGLGVGLYLAYATIERLGGRLVVTGRDGGGTVLGITLPLLSRSGEAPHGNA